VPAGFCFVLSRRLQVATSAFCSLRTCTIPQEPIVLTIVLSRAIIHLRVSSVSTLACYLSSESLGGGEPNFEMLPPETLTNHQHQRPRPQSRTFRVVHRDLYSRLLVNVP